MALEGHRGSRLGVVLARSAAGLAAVWAAAFAVLHVYWASGGRAFIGSSPQADAAFARPAFAVYNGVVAVLCVIGVAAAVALAAPRLPHGVVRLARAAAWMACALLLLRGGIGLVQACSVSAHRPATERPSLRRG